MLPEARSDTVQQNTNALTAVAEILAQGVVRLHRRRALEAREICQAHRTGMTTPAGTRPDQKGTTR